MDVRRIDHNTYDLFQGNGWDQHTRVRRGRESTFVVSGAKVPKQMLKDLHEVLHPRMPINYGQSFEVTMDNLAAIHGRH